MAIEAGVKPEMVYNVMGGFEGDKIKDKSNPQYGQRLINGTSSLDIQNGFKTDVSTRYYVITDDLLFIVKGKAPGMKQGAFSLCNTSQKLDHGLRW